jgi:hypothetical protein
MAIERLIIKYLKFILLGILVILALSLIIIYNLNQKRMSLGSRSSIMTLQSSPKMKNAATNLKIFGTDNNNHQFSIVADSGAEKSGSIEVDNLKAQMYLTSDLPSIISANNGKVIPSLEQATLNENVEIIVEGKYKLHTQKVDIFYKEGSAIGHYPVHFDLPFGTVLASGFEAKHTKSDSTITLTGPVSAHLNHVP